VSGRPRSAQNSEGNGDAALGQLLCSVIPDDVRLASVENCLDHIRLLVRQQLGEEATVVVQGSYSQGLALHGSDLDVAVVVGAQKSPARARKRSADVDGDGGTVTRRFALIYLQRLASALVDAGSPEMRIALKIFSAKVPVLRLHFRVGKRSDSTGHTGGGDTAPITIDVSIGGSLERGGCDRCVHAILEHDTSRVGAALCRLVKLWAK